MFALRAAPRAATALPRVVAASPTLVRFTSDAPLNTATERRSNYRSNNNNRSRERASATAADGGPRSVDRVAERRQKDKEYLAKRAQVSPPHLLTLADLSAADIENLVWDAYALKHVSKTYGPRTVTKSLDARSVALMFSKRSTRTRVASETSVTTLGGNAMFLGSQDIQLGVNESLRDTATVVGSMVDGIMARVAGHEEIETLAKYSPVPVINALSDLYHPTQILADLLALVETYAPDITIPDNVIRGSGGINRNVSQYLQRNYSLQDILRGKKMAWVGDTNNMTNEFLVVIPRFGMTLGVAAPKGYDKVDPRVWARVTDAQTENLVQFSNSPADVLKDADIIVTDTWISMGQEEEKAARLAAFEGYQLTNKLINESGANKEWLFMHCLPRHNEEVDDEVFYGDRSIVFPEAENRKWTIMAVFDAYMGRWHQFK